MNSLRNTLIIVVLVSVAALIYLTYDSTDQLKTRTPLLTDEIVKGKKAWQQNNCINCHTILGNGAYFAPDLTKVAAKRSEKWISSFLTSPNKVWPGTAMANLNLTSEEARYLTAFLTWVKDVDTNGWPPKPIIAGQRKQSTSTYTSGQSNEQKDSKNSDVDNNGTANDKGRRVFDAVGCSGCHQINGSGGDVGPELTMIGEIRDKEWLKSFLLNPQKFYPDTMMPAPDISDEALDVLVDYLGSLK